MRSSIIEFIKKNLHLCIHVLAGILTVLVISTFFTPKHDHVIDQPVDTTFYHLLIEDLNNKIKIADDSIATLNKLKSKTIIKYDTQIKDYLDPIAVSNDSITRYISNRISKKRHDLHLLYK